MASQLGAVTGKRIKPDYGAQIRGRVPGLLSEYQAKENRAYSDKILTMREEEFENQKKQTRTANTTNTGNLLLSAYLGHESNKNLASILGGDAAKGAAKGGGLPTLSELGSKVTSAPLKMAGSVAFGQVAGKSVGGLLPFGGEKDKEVIGSGLAAGAAGYLLTGDPYSAAISGLTSAGLSAISHW